MPVTPLSPAVPPSASPPPAGAPRQRYLALVRGETRGLRAALERLALRAASLPYGLAVRTRNALYARGWLRQQRAAVPVVSVGNLTVGGTGKTPCVEFVARFYRERDRRVAILSRGYGSVSRPNDEALLLESQLPDVPHLQGADRVGLAQTAVQELGSELLILDDGSQHRRLARDLDLVLVDATDPWGQGSLLPRGLLREPPSSLRRAHAVILTRCEQVTPEVLAALRRRVARLAPAATLAETTHRPVELVNAEGERASLDLLRDQPVAAFCGIGNPEAFRRTLADLGARPVDFRAYADHHAYSLADVEALRGWGRPLAAGAWLVTTQKDLVKLPVSQLGGRPLWAVRVRLDFRAGQSDLERLLAGVLPPH